MNCTFINSFFLSDWNAALPEKIIEHLSKTVSSSYPISCNKTTALFLFLYLTLKNCSNGLTGYFLHWNIFEFIFLSMFKKKNSSHFVWQFTISVLKHFRAFPSRKPFCLDIWRLFFFSIFVGNINFFISDQGSFALPLTSKGNKKLFGILFLSGGELLELRLIDTHLLDTFGSKSIARHKFCHLLESS